MMTRLKNFLYSVGTEMQNMENAWAQLGENLNISRAAGAVLDEFGADIELPRPTGMEDWEYRQAIQALWLIYRSSGAPNEIIYVAQEITKATVIHLREVNVGEGIGLCLFINSDVNHQAYSVYQCKSAGVPFELTLGVLGGPTFPNLVQAVSDLPEAFSPADEGLDDGLGFSELDVATGYEHYFWLGGQVVELITQ